MNNNEDNNSPVINKFTVIQSTPEPLLHRQHSYFKVHYLAFAFETLHYPWIPSLFIYGLFGTKDKPGNIIP